MRESVSRVGVHMRESGRKFLDSSALFFCWTCSEFRAEWFTELIFLKLQFTQAYDCSIKRISTLVMGRMDRALPSLPLMFCEN